MSLRSILKNLLKIILAGLIAAAILTLFCALYYTLPAHYPCMDGATDDKWEPGAFYSLWTEGGSWGRINNEGYVNAADYQPGDTLDVLIMGSSHMEAFQVAVKDSTAGKLDTLMKDGRVYNIGLSDHSFLTCADNLAAALSKYKPTKYVVIETGVLEFSDSALAAAVNGEVPDRAVDAGGFISLLQKIPLVRLLYVQFMHSMDARESMPADASETEYQAISAENGLLLDALLVRMGQTASDNGVKLIIVYHPASVLSSDGSLRFLTDDAFKTQFDTLCTESGIQFLDMSTRFSEEYAKSHTLAHGFPNSPVGSGHLNKYGHGMLAEELYKLMNGGN